MNYWKTAIYWTLTKPLVLAYRLRSAWNVRQIDALYQRGVA